jgi:predicted enzyme related to lactoylglutathione lyase
VAGVSLTLLVLKTRKLDQLRDFYQTLGVELAEEQHATGPRHYAGQVGGVVLEVYPIPDDGPADTTTRLGFAVQNLNETVGVLQSIGTPVIRQPQTTSWGFRAVVRDPDGRAVELSQR